MRDAAAAIEELQQIADHHEQTAKDYWKEACEYKAQLPKRGEWLIHSTGGSMATKKCPFCGSESWQSKEYATVPKYCQNCGAHLPTFNIVDWVHYLNA